MVTVRQDYCIAIFPKCGIRTWKTSDALTYDIQINQVFLITPSGVISGSTSANCFVDTKQDPRTAADKTPMCVGTWWWLCVTLHTIKRTGPGWPGCHGNSRLRQARNANAATLPVLVGQLRMAMQAALFRLLDYFVLDINRHITTNRLKIMIQCFFSPMRLGVSLFVIGNTLLRNLK